MVPPWGFVPGVFALTDHEHGVHKAPANERVTSRDEPLFASINRGARLRYRDGLAVPIADARHDVTPTEVTRRATDVVVGQNGMWLTALVPADPSAVGRSVRRCEALTLGSVDPASSLVPRDR